MVLGDGICSDLYNTPDCNFDGGDCCSPNSIMMFCDLCQCFNETNYITPPTTVEWVGNSESILKLSVHNILKNLLALLSMNIFSECYDPWTVGDGICDDYFNTLACNYDGGDCCFGIKGVHCIACICKDEYTNYPLKTTPAPGMIYYFHQILVLYVLLICMYMIWPLVCYADESVIGDGFCDYEATTDACDYDNGDCDGKKSKRL